MKLILVTVFISCACYGAARGQSASQAQVIDIKDANAHSDDVSKKYDNVQKIAPPHRATASPTVEDLEHHGEQESHSSYVQHITNNHHHQQHLMPMNQSMDDSEMRQNLTTPILILMEVDGSDDHSKASHADREDNIRDIYDIIQDVVEEEITATTTTTEAISDVNVDEDNDGDDGDLEKANSENMGYYSSQDYSSGFSGQAAGSAPYPPAMYSQDSYANNNQASYNGASSADYNQGVSSSYNAAGSSGVYSGASSVYNGGRSAGYNGGSTTGQYNTAGGVVAGGGVGVGTGLGAGVTGGVGRGIGAGVGIGAGAIGGLGGPGLGIGGGFGPGPGIGGGIGPGVPFGAAGGLGPIGGPLGIGGGFGLFGGGFPRYTLKPCYTYLGCKLSQWLYY